jgi:S1-C subfamily serine protease
LTAAAAGTGVSVVSVRPQSPLAKAGLEASDIVLAVDNTACADENALRRQLRRAFVLGGAELTIRRGGKLLVVTADFFGWELPAVKR